MSHRLIFSLLNSLSHEKRGQRVDLVDREDLILLREELTLCKGKDNLPYIIRRAQETLRQSSTRSILRPVLVEKLTLQRAVAQILARALLYMVDYSFLYIA